MARMTSEKFAVQIEGTHGVTVPDMIGDAFAKAGHKRVELRAYFEKKHITFHGKLHKYQGRYLISFGKQYQKELGIFPSDIFELQLLENQSKYGVEVPETLQAVMDSDPEGMTFFEALTDGKKRGLIYYVKRFRVEQTQVDKALLVFKNLKMGIIDTKELIKKR